jgi:hypothetical protein
MTFKEWVVTQYEIKKVNLLHLHRKQRKNDDMKRLIMEINVIAELLNESKINSDNVAGTLRVYPKLIKEA